MIAVYTPDLVEEAPRWTYIISAFLIFAYQVLDNVDGKQARRYVKRLKSNGGDITLAIGHIALHHLESSLIMDAMH